MQESPHINSLEKSKLIYCSWKKKKTV